MTEVGQQAAIEHGASMLVLSSWGQETFSLFAQSFMDDYSFLVSGIAFIGGSRLVVLDEPTSGLVGALN